MHCIILAVALVLLPAALSQSCTDPNEVVKPCNGLLASNLACDSSCASNPVCPGACSNALGPGWACRCRDGYVRQTLLGGNCVPLYSCGQPAPAALPVIPPPGNVVG